MKVTSPIFISYSSLDKDTVYPIVERIEKECGIKCWIDRDGLHSGDMLDDSIMDAIESSETVLFMMSDNSISSQWVRNEVLYASSQAINKRIIPVSLDGKGTRRWFSFKFPNKKHVDATQQEHIHKLVTDLKEWYGIHENQMDNGKPEALSENVQDTNPEVLVFNIIDGIDLIMYQNPLSKNNYIGKLPIEELISVMESNNKDSLEKKELKDLAKNIGRLFSFPIIAMAKMAYMIGKDIINSDVDIDPQDKEMFIKIRDYIIQYINDRYNIELKLVINEESGLSTVVAMTAPTNS